MMPMQTKVLIEPLSDKHLYEIAVAAKELFKIDGKMFKRLTKGLSIITPSYPYDIAHTNAKILNDVFIGTHWEAKVECFDNMQKE